MRLWYVDIDCRAVSAVDSLNVTEQFFADEKLIIQFNDNFAQASRVF